MTTKNEGAAKEPKCPTCCKSSGHAKWCGKKEPKHTPCDGTGHEGPCSGGDWDRCDKKPKPVHAKLCVRLSDGQWVCYAPDPKTWTGTTERLGEVTCPSVLGR